MEEVRRGPRMDHQWIPASLSTGKGIHSDRGERGNGRGLGNGALQFIRNRGSLRRQGKRESGNRHKTSSEGHTTASDADGSGNGGGGGFGKWLRDHLGGGSRGNNQEIVPSMASKSRSNCSSSYDLSFTGSDKSLTRMTYTPQNLYCSLPREHHRRHFHIGTASKTSYDVTRERAGCSNSASAEVNFRERSESRDLESATRSGDVCRSEGKSSKKRERERRRHSMNETRAHCRLHRIRPALREMEKNLKNLDDLKSEVERLFPLVKICLEESRSDSSRADRSLKADETRTTVTRMTKVKRSSLGSKKPGRC